MRRPQIWADLLYLSFVFFSLSCGQPGLCAPYPFMTIVRWYSSAECKILHVVDSGAKCKIERNRRIMTPVNAQVISNFLDFWPTTARSVYRVTQFLYHNDILPQSNADRSITYIITTWMGNHWSDISLLTVLTNLHRITTWWEVMRSGFLTVQRGSSCRDSVLDVARRGFPLLVPAWRWNRSYTSVIVGRVSGEEGHIPNPTFTKSYSAHPLGRLCHPIINEICQLVLFFSLFIHRVAIGLTVTPT